MATVLSREDILKAEDLLIEFVKTPEWAPKGHANPDEFGVYARGLTGTDRDAFEMAMLEQRRVTSATTGRKKEVQVINLQNLRAKLVVRGAVDTADPDTAQPIFSPEDVTALGRKSALALNRVYQKIRELSGLTDEDVDEMTADLGEGQSDASGSNSPSLLGIEASPNVNAGSVPGSSLSGRHTTSSSPLETGALTS